MKLLWTIWTFIISCLVTNLGKYNISECQIIALADRPSLAQHVMSSVVCPVLILPLCYCYCCCLDTHAILTYLLKDFFNAHNIVIHELNSLQRQWYKFPAHRMIYSHYTYFPVPAVASNHSFCNATLSTSGFIAFHTISNTATPTHFTKSRGNSGLMMDLHVLPVCGAKVPKLLLNICVTTNCKRVHRTRQIYSSFGQL